MEQKFMHKKSRTLCSAKKSAVSKLQSVVGGFCYDLFSTSPTMAYRAKSLGILHCDGGDMPMVAQPLHKLKTQAILFFERIAKSLWSIFCGSGSL
jgi:hypothetical protein